mgnify:CR=1 FL=1
MVKEITSQELADNLQQNTERAFTIIDVREYNEYESGSIPGSVHIPLGEIVDRLHEINKEIAHFIICRSGARSGRVSEFLHQQGYNVTNVVGGMLDWEGKVQ